jgi:hypothetical protein
MCKGWQEPEDGHGYEKHLYSRQTTWEVANKGGGQVPPEAFGDFNGLICALELDGMEL